MTNTTTTNSSLSKTNSSYSPTNMSINTTNVRGYINSTSVSTISIGTAAGIVVGIVLFIIVSFIFLYKVHKKNYTDTNLTLQKKKTTESTTISTTDGVNNNNNNNEYKDSTNNIVNSSVALTGLKLSSSLHPQEVAVLDHEYISSASAYDSFIDSDSMLTFHFDDTTSILTDDFLFLQTALKNIDSFTDTGFMLMFEVEDNVSIMTDDYLFRETVPDFVNINDNKTENAFVLTGKIPLNYVSTCTGNRLTNTDNDNMSEITHSTYSSYDVSIKYAYDSLYIETVQENFSTDYLQHCKQQTIIELPNDLL